MDSFVLAETFKYLYLLFSEESEHTINIHDFIFTTEAHLLPLYLSQQPAPPTNATEFAQVITVFLLSTFFFCVLNNFEYILRLEIIHLWETCVWKPLFMTSKV